MPFGRSPAPPRWWWSKSPVAGSERQPMSTRKSAAASAASSRVRTISSGPWTRPSTATAKTSSAWKLPGWVATTVMSGPGTPRAARPRAPTAAPAARRRTVTPKISRSTSANSSRSSTTFGVHRRADRPSSVRARSVVMRSTLGCCTTSVLTKLDSGSVAIRRWCGSKADSGELLLGHPEAAERAPLVLAHPPRAARLALQRVGERADRRRALAERQRVQVALAQPGVGQPALTVEVHEQRHVVDRPLAADHRLVVGDDEPDRAQQRRQHRVELEAVAAAPVRRAAAPISAASSSGAVSPSCTARSSYGTRPT